MADTTLWAELLAFGTGLALSPIHLGVLLLLLLGPKPIQRGSWFVTGWIVTTLVTVILLLTVGHSLVLDMTQGSHHRTALDLLGGGALISLGLKELLRSFAAGEETTSLDQYDRTIYQFAAAAFDRRWCANRTHQPRRPLPICQDFSRGPSSKPPQLARNRWLSVFHIWLEPAATDPPSRRDHWQRTRDSPAAIWQTTFICQR